MCVCVCVCVCVCNIPQTKRRVDGRPVPARRPEEVCVLELHTGSMEKRVPAQNKKNAMIKLRLKVITRDTKTKNPVIKSISMAIYVAPTQTHS